MTGRALSIREPHASLILKGIKHYETREYSTSYRGTIYIHAGKQYGDTNPELIKLLGYKPDKLGYLLFKAELTDCIPITDEFRESISETEKTCGYYIRKYAWKIENVQAIDPVPYRGMLGIFPVEI